MKSISLYSGVLWKLLERRGHWTGFGCMYRCLPDWTEVKEWHTQTWIEWSGVVLRCPAYVCVCVCRYVCVWLHACACEKFFESTGLLCQISCDTDLRHRVWPCLWEKETRWPPGKFHKLAPGEMQKDETYWGKDKIEVTPVWRIHRGCFSWVSMRGHMFLLCELFLWTTAWLLFLFLFYVKW